MESRDYNLIYERQAGICKALSDPKRIMIIHSLRDGEKTVSELMEDLGLAQANLSQHLAVMRDRGLVSARRKGNNAYYSLTSPKITQACDIVRAVLVEQLEQGGELVSSLRE